jgi:L-glyceraldehyde 3-phosphate reductase
MSIGTDCDPNFPITVTNIDVDRKILPCGVAPLHTHRKVAVMGDATPGSAEDSFGRILRQDLAAHRDELIISTKAGWEMWPGPYGDLGSRKYLIASLD